MSWDSDCVRQIARLFSVTVWLFMAARADIRRLPV